jgi:hypothetical protein
MRCASLLLLLLLNGCDDAAREPAAVSDAAMPMTDAAIGAELPPLGVDPLAHLPHGLEQLQHVCARDGADMVRSLFCQDAPQTFGNIVELQKALFADGAHLQGISGVAIAGHSTSLGAHAISSINPRVIGVRLEHPSFDAAGNPAAPGSQEALPPELELIATAFSRGDQFIELMVRDRLDYELRFYLVTFRQACNDREEGCKPGDLFTPELEQNWLETSLYDEHDLANTVVDCAPCHQTNGPGTAKFLRMQELRTPWTHWFGLSDGGRALIADYKAAKDGETLAGLTAAQLDRANPVNLNLQAVYGGPNSQPNAFNSEAIEAEVRSSAAANGGAQPEDNSVPGESATWREGYERAKHGEAITFPYHDVKVTDEAKLARMTEAYRAYRSGELEQSELPDLRDIFPDDPQRLAEMGFTTEPGLSGEDVLTQACAICHNDRLDQSLSRARFRANLEDMSREEKDRAIERLRLPIESPFAMPPPRLRTLSAEARTRAIEVLMR